MYLLIIFMVTVTEGMTFDVQRTSFLFIEDLIS